MSEILDKAIPAQCTRCPHMGSSKNPKYYLCGACYYLAHSAGEKRKANVLRERAKRADALAAKHAVAAAAFQRRHPGTGRLPMHLEKKPGGLIWPVGGKP